MLYQVAIMQRKKKKSKEKLVFMSDWIIAASPEKAGMKVIGENGGSIDIDYDDMEILVRPFV